MKIALMALTLVLALTGCEHQTYSSYTASNRQQPHAWDYKADLYF